MKRFFARFLPTSLQYQMLLAVALVLLAVQSLSGGLRYSAQVERREVALLNGAAFGIMGAERFARLRDGGDPDGPDDGPGGDHEAERNTRPGPEIVDEPVAGGGGRDLTVHRHGRSGRRGPFIERSDQSPLLPGEQRMTDAEQGLRRIFAGQGFVVRDVVVVERSLASDPLIARWIATHRPASGPDADQLPPQRMWLAAARLPDGGWVIGRIPVPRADTGLIVAMIAQTVLLYGVLVGVMAILLRRITRPLELLTGRVERFAEKPTADAQLVPEGPDDVRRLIVAHNAMEARVRGLLDEKDVMLGAIGHDLKTPLASLRVRIESVEDEIERRRMAATIEDIVRTLDDILSLARVGRPSDPLEPTELGALAGAVVEEFEDMDRDVTLDVAGRIVARLRPTWLRRALRNLVENAVRYGDRARVFVSSDNGFAVVRVEDDGPGIPPNELVRMQEPFTRLDASRNKALGGAGLGLALARAIAEQHGGTLLLVNRMGAGGKVAGLNATIRVPLQPAG